MIKETENKTYLHHIIATCDQVGIRKGARAGAEVDVHGGLVARVGEVEEAANLGEKIVGKGARDRKEKGRERRNA